VKSKSLTLTALLALTILSGCAGLLKSGDSDRKYVAKSAAKYLNSLVLRSSSWSVMAVDLADGRIIIQQDADRALIPASGIKVLVTACALETLGPEYRLRTTLGYTGRLDASGTLDGDLVVLGAGDPTISTRYVSVARRRTSTGQIDSSDTFEAWADSLAAHGVRHITGGLIGSAGLFGGAPLGSGWEWDDLPSGFATEFGPLVYADGCLETVITPADSVGKAANISYWPKVENVYLQGTVVTAEQGSEPDISFDRTLGANQIAIWGSIPLSGEPQRRWISVHDPAGFFLKNLQAALERKGITVAGGTIATATWKSNTTGFTPLFHDPSPTLINMITVINQQSSNLYSELLIRMLGVHYRSQHPEAAGLNAFEAGRNLIRDWEATLPGTASSAVLADGSGLSRQNLLSASELIKILVHMNRSQYRISFMNSLARPGEPGTLEKRFLGLPKGITLNAKTGSLTRVRSLSGYLFKDNQPRIVFSMICNNNLGAQDEADQAMDNMVQLMALYLKENRN
jgi:D-alanyl-D-alanine carboxypeptidase/D-alanyl-D-alanine-endopeptidase (penicillin-binding protein 4)